MRVYIQEVEKYLDFNMWSYLLMIRLVFILEEIRIVEVVLFLIVIQINNSYIRMVIKMLIYLEDKSVNLIYCFFLQF